MKRLPGPGHRPARPWVFPGEIAGASLKRMVGAGAAPETKVFPGEIAGASLKPPLRRAREAVGCWFSPAKSPGPH